MAFKFGFDSDVLPSYKITKPVRLIELFGGVGTQAMAMRDIGADFERYRLVEIDKDAVNSYNAIHKTNFTTQDICNIKGDDLGITDKDKYEYVLTYSFPCTNLSCSGKQEGMSKGSDTRSGLLWEVERLLTETKELPQVLVMENVVQVHNSKNMPDFKNWLDFLENKGYKNYYKDLNAKDFNVAQSRERCFMVSILGNYSYTFPEPIGLHKSIKDYLENDVDKKYYLPEDKCTHLLNNLKERGLYTILEDFYANRPVRTYNETCPTLRAERSGLKVICAMRGRQTDGTGAWIQRLEPNTTGVCNTLTTVGKDNLLLSEENNSIQVRYLTAKECWRFMSYSDTDYECAAQVCTKTQLCKQAGNAIVKDVLAAIFKKLF